MKATRCRSIPRWLQAVGVFDLLYYTYNLATVPSWPDWARDAPWVVGLGLACFAVMGVGLLYGDRLAEPLAVIRALALLFVLTAGAIAWSTLAGPAHVSTLTDRERLWQTLSWTWTVGWLVVLLGLVGGGYRLDRRRQTHRRTATRQTRAAETPPGRERARPRRGT